MTVSELVDKLRKMPQNAIAVVRGYEGGYDDVNDVKAIKIELNPNAWDKDQRYKEPRWYEGVYEIVKDDKPSEVIPIDAVFIEQYDEEGKHEAKLKEAKIKNLSLKQNLKNQRGRL